MAKDDVELVVLDQEGARHLYSQIGAQGCQKRAAYVFSADIDTWEPPRRLLIAAGSR